jgi:hypothetical protein
MIQNGRGLSVDVSAMGAAADRERAVLASLPKHVRLAAGERADAYLISSRAAGWPDHLERALRDGAGGVLLTGAGAAEPGVLESLARLAGRLAIPVVVDVRFAHDPTWAAALPELTRGESQEVIIDCLVHGGADSLAATDDGWSLVDLLVAQLTLVRPLIPSFDTLACAHYSASGYAVCGEVGGAVVNMAGANSLTGAASLRLQVAGLDRRWDAVFNDGAVAQPTLVTRHTATGSSTLPVLYEGSRRTAWRQLYSAVTAGATVAYGLNELGLDRAVAERLLGVV